MHGSHSKTICYTLHHAVNSIGLLIKSQVYAHPIMYFYVDKKKIMYFHIKFFKIILLKKKVFKNNEAGWSIQNKILINPLITTIIK